MKQVLFLLLSIISVATYAQETAKILFAEETFEFGELDEGPKVTHEFAFTNEGTAPLVLSNVKASCGCTVPEWPKEPIMPGESSSIMVTYNTAKRIGSFTKTITVSSNDAENVTKMLYIKGKVVKAPEEETMPVKQPLMMAPSTN